MNAYWLGGEDEAFNCRSQVLLNLTSAFERRLNRLSEPEWGSSEGENTLVEDLGLQTLQESRRVVLELLFTRLH